VIYAIRNIKAGEELLFDYNYPPEIASKFLANKLEDVTLND
jgi:SET domain-containing protein